MTLTQIKIRYFEPLILCVIFAFLSSVPKAQQYGNEWINYGQQYLYFPVVQTGVHQINFSTLNTSLNSLGVNLNQINHDQFQIFGKEKELSLKIYDQNNNGIIDSSDHIEFYATKNDGWIDHLAYDTITNMPDEYYSLFNDTIQYYLTWNNNFNNKRTIDESDINFNNYNSKWMYNC